MSYGGNRVAAREAEWCDGTRTRGTATGGRGDARTAPASFLRRKKTAPLGITPPVDYKEVKLLRAHFRGGKIGPARITRQHKKQRIMANAIKAPVHGAAAYVESDGRHASDPLERSKSWPDGDEVASDGLPALPLPRNALRPQGQRDYFQTQKAQSKHNWSARGPVPCKKWTARLHLSARPAIAASFMVRYRPRYADVMDRRFKVTVIRSPLACDQEQRMVTMPVCCIPK